MDLNENVIRVDFIGYNFIFYNKFFLNVFFFYIVIQKSLFFYKEIFR